MATADAEAKQSEVVDSSVVKDVEQGYAPTQAKKFALSSRSDESAKPLTLKFSNVKLTASVSKMDAMMTGTPQTSKQILHGVEGVVHSGEVLAIIGPSGAGKTSLLDILVGKIKNGKHGLSMEGDITVNAEPMTHEFFIKNCAYMPQDDLLWSALTVRENLWYAVRLYCPALSASDQVTRVEDALQDLGLTGCADTKIGNPMIKGVSGGQKRRASIGVEVVAGRRLLFLDEPTSGLDAASASQIAALLRELASARNIAIVCSIHQPSTQVFLAFDKVMLLTMGQTAYFGSAADALPHFEQLGRHAPPNYNPADFLLEITNSDFYDKKAVEDLAEAWPESAGGKKLTEAVAEANRHRQESMPIKKSIMVRFGEYLAQLWTLMSRVALIDRRDPAAYLVRIFMYAFMSCFLGSVYYKVGNTQDDIYNRVFVILWVQAFNSYMTSASLPVFSIDREVILNEVHNGRTDVGRWCIANAVVQVPFMMFVSLIAVIPVYFITDMGGNANDDVAAAAGRFFLFTLIMFGLLYAMESLGVLVGTAIRDVILALSMFSTTVSCFFIFNGQFISVNTIPNFWIWLYWISPFKYSYEALMKIVFRDQTFSGMDTCETCYGATGSEVLDSLTNGGTQLNNVNIGAWFGALLLWSFVARLWHYYILKSAATH